MTIILALCGLVVATGFAQVPTTATDTPDTPLPPPVTTASGADARTGFHYGALTITPELDLSVFYDSNPTYTGGSTGSNRSSRSVIGFKMQPMLDFVLNGGSWIANARAWMTHDYYPGNIDPTYRDTIEKNHYGESIGVNWTTPHDTHYSLTEFFEYQQRNDPVWAPSSGGTGGGPGGTVNNSWGDRYSFAVGSAMDTRLSEKSSMNLGVSFPDVWYSNPALYGWQDLGGTLGFRRQLTARTDLLLDFGTDAQWSDGSAGRSQSYRALVGLGTQPDAISTYRISAGFMGYDFNNGSNTAYAMTYSVSGNWRLSQRLSATLNGSANFQPSETSQNSYTIVDTLAGGLNYLVSSRLTTSAGVVLRHEAWANRDPLYAQQRRDNELDIYTRANYQFHRYASVFVGADISGDASTLSPATYNRLFLEAGVKLRF